MGSALKALVVAASILGASGAQAAIVISLASTSFTPGGTASGSMTVTDDYASVISWSFTTTAGRFYNNRPGGAVAPGAVYDMTTSTLSDYYARASDNRVQINLYSASGYTFIFGGTRSGATLVDAGISEDGSGLVYRLAAGPTVQTSITTVANSPVPEPASWAMFIGGFGLIGGAMRRRRRTAVAFA
jgi:hypothetical protein